MNPVGGKDDYRALWHEMGHTLHFANSEESLPYEFKYYGLNSTSEIYAFLFAHMFHDDNFLRKYSEMNEKQIIIKPTIDDLWPHLNIKLLNYAIMFIKDGPSTARAFWTLVTRSFQLLGEAWAT